MTTKLVVHMKGALEEVGKLPADSFPITRVTFSLFAMAVCRRHRACLRKARNEFLKTAIVDEVDVFVFED
jgi:hypothetical protein